MAAISPIYSHARQRDAIAHSAAARDGITGSAFT